MSDKSGYQPKRKKIQVGNADKPAYHYQYHLYIPVKKNIDYTPSLCFFISYFSFGLVFGLVL